jgi:hypothetical protein
MRQLLSAAVVALSAGTLGAADFDEQARWVADVEQTKGHLLASREVYRRGQHVRAGVHASHPIQELGYRLWRPVSSVERTFGAQVQAALKEPGRAVEARMESRGYDALVDRTLALLDRALTRVLPEALRAPTRASSRG